MKKTLLLALIAFGINANASDHSVKYPDLGAKSASQKCREIADPFESFNRKVFTFNSVLDHFLLRPIAKGYRNTFSDNARAKVGNAVENFKVPVTAINNALQGEPKNVLLSFWQFAINTTFGIGGLENVSKKVGLQVKPQTFGNTLASYGVGPGPYIVLPFLGGTNTRDMLDPIVLNSAMNPINYSLESEVERTVTGVTLVSSRAEILPFTDHVAKTSTDPYATIRSSIHQAREDKVQYPKHYKCKK